MPQCLRIFISSPADVPDEPLQLTGERRCFGQRFQVSSAMARRCQSA
jgi:hypothetical protein